MGKSTARRFRFLYFPVLFILLLVSWLATRRADVTGHTRVLFLTTLIVAIAIPYVYLLSRFASRRFASITMVVVPLLFIAWTVFGGRGVDSEALRSAYINQLQSYKGVPYVWGGETGCGIDCSGLARTALWQVMLKQGVLHANPKLFGPELWRFWWLDTSAKDMMSGKYGYTRAIGHADQMAGYDTSSLKPGDLALIDGVHVLIYVGDGKWTDASPEDQKVVVNRAPADSKRGWFKLPVTFARWWVLDDK